MKIKEKLRNIYLWYLRRLFKNEPELSVISNNCLGGVVLHDRGLRFNSPTVNLWIPAHDYVRMLQHPEMMYNILTNANRGGYPQGVLEDVPIHLLHYKTFEDGCKAWRRRMERIVWDNLYVVLTERDGCSYEDLKAFDRLPFKNKVALCHRYYEDIRSCFVVKGFEHSHEVGNMFDYTGLLGRRRYDQFPWNKFLKGKTKYNEK